ncbi:polysaccharide deacetylase family protein [Streptomyces sp. NPDC047079]|uniref:polysaccharide deacetylase family protein n=1 Tax=Streptomyces sp. NPDC047079 TaxID=3154607 RepID=UPI0033DD81F4
MGRMTTPVPPSPSDSTPPDRATGTARTVPDRRSALRAGAGLAVGAIATACSPGPTAVRPPFSSRTADNGSPGSGIQAPRPRSIPGQPDQITHGPRDRPRVALTFHGEGDPSLATAILERAEHAGARITVLAVGSWLDEHPDIARRILRGGHDLGNHTQRHLAINTMSEADARAEIQGCADRLRRLTGSIGTWFRPSRAPRATPLVARLAHDVGYPHVLSYDVDSLDYTSPGARAITHRVLEEVRKGSVVSLHFGQADTVVALPAILHALDDRGLAAVTTTELLS